MMAADNAELDLLTYLIEGWLGQREDGYWSIDGESITDDYR